MSFTTALFWFFILIGVVIYYVLPSKVRWMWLLVLSYLYYFSFNVKNSLFMVAASLVIYLAALAMEYIQDKSDAYLKEHKAEINREQKKKLKNSVKHKKRIILVIAMLINFGVLAVLKYGGFLQLIKSSNRSLHNLREERYKKTYPEWIPFCSVFSLIYINNIRY